MVKTCRIDLLNECPPHSTCYQHNSTVGYCICEPQNEFHLNIDKGPNQSYCIHSSASAAYGNDEAPSKQSYQQFDKHTHIIGGIVIPLLAVVIVLGLVFVAKRYKVTVRFRQYIRNRQRRQPVYEDVYLGNPSDEPPLI
jgi:hypothetical protein